MKKQTNNLILVSILGVGVANAGMDSGMAASVSDKMTSAASQYMNEVNSITQAKEAIKSSVSEKIENNIPRTDKDSSTIGARFDTVTTYNEEQKAYEKSIADSNKYTDVLEQKIKSGALSSATTTSSALAWAGKTYKFYLASPANSKAEEVSVTFDSTGGIKGGAQVSGQSRYQYYTNGRRFPYPHRSSDLGYIKYSISSNGIISTTYVARSGQTCWSDHYKHRDVVYSVRNGSLKTISDKTYLKTRSAPDNCWD